MLTTKRLAIIALAAITATLGACAGPKGKTIGAQRDYAFAMRDKVIAEFVADPKVDNGTGQQKIDEAAGYAVFANWNLKILFVGIGNGYGVVHNNDSGEDTIMRMATAGAGVGIAAEDIKNVLLFKTEAALNRFIDAGWQTGAAANAAAVAGDAGGAATAQADFGPDVDIWKFTKNGAALSATFDVAKYWVDRKLNDPDADPDDPYEDTEPEEAS